MGTQIQRNTESIYWVFVIVIAVVTILVFGHFVPTAVRISAGLVLALTSLLVFLVERQTRKDVFRELEYRIGWVNFQLAKPYIRYLTSFNISLDIGCRESIKKKVLQFFDEIELRCRVVDRRKRK